MEVVIFFPKRLFRNPFNHTLRAANRYMQISVSRGDFPIWLLYFYALPWVTSTFETDPKKCRYSRIGGDEPFQNTIEPMITTTKSCGEISVMQAR